MDFDEYQRQVTRTLQPEDRQTRTEMLSMVALGIAGEAGEVVDLIKKHLFHGHPIDDEKLCGELGDLLWYVAAMATRFNLELSLVADQNIAKLRRRYPYGFSKDASRNREPER